MFRTKTTDFYLAVTRRTSAPPVRRARPLVLRLHWTVRDGRSTARWQRESDDLTEGDASSIPALPDLTLLAA
jgi:hypothetical protein